MKNFKTHIIAIAILIAIMAFYRVKLTHAEELPTTDINVALEGSQEVTEAYDETYENAVIWAFNQVNPIVWESYDELSLEDIETLYQTINDMVERMLNNKLYGENQ